MRFGIEAALDRENMQALRFLLYVMIASLGTCGWVAQAQSPLSTGGDLPTQRWIPIPQGQQPNFSAQAELLQQLRDFVAGKESNSPLPQLSEAQLQQIEQAFQDWKSQLGETSLPNLDSIPREWIEDALADPLARMQAQRLLEQYAQARSLPPPSSNPTRPGQNAIPLPQSNALRQPNPNRDRDNSGTASNNPSRYTPAEDQAGPSTQLAKDAERMQALRDLFEKLQGTQTPPAPSDAPPQNANRNSLANRTDSSPSSIGARPRSNRPTVSSGNARAGEQILPPVHSPNVPLGNSIRRQTNSAVSTAEGTSAPNQDDASGLSDSAKSTHSKSTPNSSPSFPLGSGNSNDSPTVAGPSDVWSDFSPKASDGKNGPLQPNAARAQPPAIPKNSPSGSAAAESKRNVELDVKSEVERHGLGETLRRIVEKTIKDETAKRDPSVSASSGKSASPGSWWSKGPKVPEAKTGDSNRNSRSSRAWAQDAARAAATKAQSLAQGSENAVKDSHFAKAFASVWKAISSVPDNVSVGNTSSAHSSTNSGDPSPHIKFHWGSSGWQILLLSVSLAGLLLYLARRRLQRTSAQAVDGRWVKEMLEVGIRTRADVVRAFHNFVLRRPQPASLWWTHRHVANRLAESSPNLRTAIEELTSVYEQARYLPPEIELSTEQFERVQTVLQRCKPCSL